MKAFTITEFIRLIVLSLLILWGFFLLKPFIGVFTWGIILAVALFPLFQKLHKVFGEKHKKKATFIFTIVAVALLVVPTYMMVDSLFSNLKDTFSAIQNNELKITPPTEKVKDWPVIGERVYDNWNALSENSKNYAIEHKDYLLDKGSNAFKKFTGLIGTILSFLLSFIIAVVFMTNAKGAFQSASDFANKLVGSIKGAEMLLIARDTVRNVVKGILFVAIIQAFLCFIGFKLMGIPGPAIFAFIVMLAAIVQIPVTLVVIPTIFMAYSISDSTLIATIFTIYIVVVSLLDNVLKPILLSKGLETPMVLIILGALGGMLLHGIIGIFIGTVLLSVLHKLYVAWVDSKEEIVLAD
ncbi:AI-2E family transporter [Xanthomarina sp. F2636L]|uniref:AI-2E family transporter n=1 Tax=Xanthomarina sp. F2636L TaxID=2996018 RepID=UPI00225E4167|nr:AI-2E family transporter [Xanthomarina sp. F2636L]MCX7550374.1 AI-2E family transporter [Xanthomarina sp. F2636L]